MTFLVDSPASWIVIALAALAAIGLLAAEWRRPDGQRRSWRIGATALAVGALALWALRPAWNGGRMDARTGDTDAVLWTTSARIVSVPAGVDARHRFALPKLDVPADAGVTFLPDAATMRRRFPEIGRVRLLGDGLDPSELPALTGLRVEFDGGARPAVGGEPVVLSVSGPNTLPLGRELVVEGRVGGLPAGGAAALTLEGPDGTATSAATAPADANGEAGFLLRAPSPNAAGRFAWRLRLKENAGENARVVADETLGVEVRAPSLPRVLILESAPRFDTAGLRRWYEAAGGTLRARLRLGQDRYRFFAADSGNGAAPGGEFNALDAGLLAGFDLVLADGRALASLPAPERAVLRTAVEETGLGVLVLADDAFLPPATVAPDRAWLFPWQLRPLDASASPGVDAAAADAEHLARLQWPGLAPGTDLPLPTAPFEIVLRPGQTPSVRDDQGRVLAAATGFGRGTLALTLVRETGRWQRANEPGLFAGYWSALFAQVARPLDSPRRWTLAEGAPAFVDRPLEFVWTGAADGAPPESIRVTDESGGNPVALPPAADPREPGRWRVTFWPRRAGWHRIVSGAAEATDFYVNPAGSWAALAAERRRAATARFAARSAEAQAPAAPSTTEPAPLPAGWWFGAFLLGAGFLWTERRMARA